jgi:predicted transcriptional regulator
MPPSGFSSHAVKGALQFVRGCYEDLLAEVRSGKHENYEQAIEYELAQIGKALSNLHISERGIVIAKPKQAKGGGG